MFFARSFLPRSDGRTRFGHDPLYDLFFAESKDSGKRVYVSHRKRLRLYKNGIDRRMQWVLSDYCFDSGLVRKGDLVVDVGANIGEIGLWATEHSADYIAFEPDPSAYKALVRNVPGGKLLEIGLSDQAGRASFFLDTANADSTLFSVGESSQQIEIAIDTMDNILAEQEPDRPIRLLKVEAEGMEPEVLRGASATLARCEYVAVDAGPERGGENTVPAVLSVLYEAGFEVIRCYLRRGTFLFERK